MGKRKRLCLDLTRATDVARLDALLPEQASAAEIEEHRVKRETTQDHPKSSRRTKEQRRTSSDLMELEALLQTSAFAEIATLIQSCWPTDQPGRPASTTPTTVAVGAMATIVFGTQRKAFVELGDPQHWRRLANTVRSRWPGNPELWLPPTSCPTRDAHRRARRFLGSDCIAAIEAVTRIHGLDTQRLIINGGRNPLSRPETGNVIYGDMTEIRSRTDFRPGTFGTRVDGSKYPHLADASAGPISDNPAVVVDQYKAPTDRSKRRPRGIKVVTIAMRNRHGNERVILAKLVVPQGKGDAEVFVDWVLEHHHEFPQVTVAVYDMALRGAQAHRLVGAGIVPMTKIPLTRRHKPDSANLGQENFTLTDGTVEHHSVFTYNGQAGIRVSAAGRYFFIPLIRGQIRRHKTTMYLETTVPHFPEVSTRLRRARCLIRLNSTAKELAAGINRAAHLRAFPEGDPVFDELFGLREDAESYHNKYKSYLWGKRARSTNPDENALDRALWQLLENTRARTAYNNRLAPQAAGPPLAASG